MIWNIIIIIVVGSFIPCMSIDCSNIFYFSLSLSYWDKISSIFVIRSVVDDFESVIAKCNGKFL